MLFIFVLEVLIHYLSGLKMFPVPKDLQLIFLGIYFVFKY